MTLLVLVLSRLVPLMFLASLTLIGARYVFDILIERRPLLARCAAAGIVLFGVVAGTPSAARSLFLVGANWALPHEKYQLADLFFDRYDAWGGRRSQAFVQQWAYSRMNLGQWKEAEEVLEISDDPNAPQTRLMIGICQYYAHDPAAASTLQSVPPLSNTQLCIREYLLGRLAEVAGRRDEALGLYWRSVAFDRNFFPAVYHGVRLLLAAGNRAAAARVLDTFLHDFPAYARAEDVLTLKSAIASGTPPPDKEFVIVTA
jgi:tetratricopeptide (TPR) repeat protein